MQANNTHLHRTCITHKTCFTGHSNLQNTRRTLNFKRAGDFSWVAAPLSVFTAETRYIRPTRTHVRSHGWTRITQATVQPTLFDNIMGHPPFSPLVNVDYFELHFTHICRWKTTQPCETNCIKGISWFPGAVCCVCVCNDCVIVLFLLFNKDKNVSFLEYYTHGAVFVPWNGGLLLYIFKLSPFVAWNNHF